MSDQNDIVAVGLDLKPKTLVQAYSEGVFPWPTEGLPLLWYFPKRRGIIEFENLHISRSMNRVLKNPSWTYSVDRAFESVMDACSSRDDCGTWINSEMKAAYLRLHQLGHAHSIEVWEDGNLIGGMYGVDVAGYFAGESMFHRKTNASKAALYCAVALQKRAGRTWMDVQVLSPHLETLGATEITAARFKNKLKTEKERLKLLGPNPPFSPEVVFSYGDFSILTT
jgi:leucyl/phenylalanyl-tRNA--protein transferase